MQEQLETTLALLERTPATLNALLRGLPNFWTRSSEGGDTWTAFDVVAHLIDCERANWMPRARNIREHSDTRAFPPFARDGYLREGEGRSLEQLLDTFASLRKENLAEVASWNLRPAEMEQQGTHPAFGLVTLGQLLATWATHDLTHLHQISRTLAYQYKEAVGPWIQYLGVLQCTGHGS